MIRTNLKRAREELGITSTEAAYKLGISLYGYSAIERGLRDPRGSTCVKLTKLFNRPIEDLLFVQDDSTTIEAEQPQNPDEPQHSSA